jgi:hypothetical protein
MSVAAAIANAAWGVSCLPAWRRFRIALHRPQAAQHAVLRQLILHAAQTVFGREHHFDHVRDYQDFVTRVPVRHYEELEPWIDQIRRGGQNVLTPGRVVRLVPTSGTTAARKLIPYTAALQREFNSAVGAWICDLFHSDPSLITGSAYWSISPAIEEEPDEGSAIPIGFAQDSEYLGKVRSRFLDWVMAVPSSVQMAHDVDEFRKKTINHLLGRPDLRLISIWHPSFLTLLLKDMPQDLHKLWPRLRLISCWADGAASAPAEQLARRFPDVIVQPKGLIATEAIVSIPFHGRHPLAVTSHFLEFLDEQGVPHEAHELKVDEQYEVVVTTAGGLWRYRLNDVVRVDGFVGSTPSIRFIGKRGNVSDLRGEKLSEAFVSQVLQQLRRGGQLDATFAMLAPGENSYTLFLQGRASMGMLDQLEQLLRMNPHYGYCRDLGQLGAVRLFQIDGGDAHAVVLTRLTREGKRMGQIKPSSLSRLDDWHRHFTGRFV